MSSRALAILILTVAAAAIPLLGKAALVSPSGIQVMAADDRGIVLKVIPPPFELIDTEGADGAYQRLHVEGWAAVSEPGNPELPLTGTMIEVPELGEIGIEAVEEGCASLDVRLRPVEAPGAHAGGQTGSQFVSQEAVSSLSTPATGTGSLYLPSGFYPGEPAQISSRSTMRGVTVARVSFHPFQWNPYTGKLKHCREILASIRFQSPLPARSLPLSLGSHSLDSGGAGRLWSRLSDEARLSHGRNSVPHAGKPPAPSQIEEDLLQADSSLRIEVKHDGLYRLTAADLLQAGVPIDSIAPATLRIFNRGKEAALRIVSKAADRFQAEDFIEFFGQGIDTPFTDTNVYWLYWGRSRGRRMGRIDGRISGTGVAVSSFTCKRHIEENHEIWHDTPGAPERDYWFWRKLNAPDSHTFPIQIPAPAGSGSDAILRVCFQGITTSSPHPNHHTRILLNGNLIVNELWDMTVEHIAEAHLSAGALWEGANSLTIELPGDSGAPVDQAYLNWIEIEYRRRLEAVANELIFTVQGEGRHRLDVGKLSLKDVSIYDITDPYRVKRVIGFEIKPDGGCYQAAFEDSLSGSKTYLAVGADRILSPYRVELYRPAHLKSRSNGADYILITARELLPAAAPLLTFRRAQGLRAKAVAVEDITNELSHGLLDPQAIRDFLKYAYESWKPPAPLYVFLLGDGCVDYRGYTGAGKRSLVPVHISSTSTLAVTPDDNWFVAVEGDDALPEMLIGRASAGSSEAAASAVRKILRYEKAADYQPRKALLAADSPAPFEAISEKLAGFVPAYFDMRRVYLRSFSSAKAARRTILSSIGKGMLVTSYVGHGNMTSWGGADKIFESSDIARLRNKDRLTFVASFECLNGYFAHYDFYSLGEELVASPGRGAIGVFASSSLGLTWEHEILGQELFRSIFQEGSSVLGAVTTRSKVEAFARGAREDVLRSFVLLGDPAVRLKWRAD